MRKKKSGQLPNISLQCAVTENLCTFLFKCSSKIVLEWKKQHILLQVRLGSNISMTLGCCVQLFKYIKIGSFI